MRRIWAKKWVRRTVYSVIVLAALLVPACWYFGISSHKDVFAYVAMSRECHPVWKALALKQVHAGQPIEEVIRTTSPVRIERYGVYTTISYQESGSFTGINLLGKNNRLVNAVAWSCTWDHTFFDELNKEDWMDWEHSYQTFIDDRIKKRKLANGEQ